MTMSDEQKNMMKEAMKEALKEWLDDKYREVGHWTVSAFLVAAMVGLMYLALKMDGWHR